MRNFCTKCGKPLNTDGICPNCTYKTNSKEKKGDWFKSPNDTDLGIVSPADSTEEFSGMLTPPVVPPAPTPPVKPPKKPVPPKRTISPKQKKIAIIATACVVLIAVISGVLVLLFSGKTKNTTAPMQDGETIQEKYMDMFGSYATVEGYSIETNEFGEKIVSADVSCPNYREIYSSIYEEIPFDDNKTNEQIDKIFFDEVSKQLKKNDDYTFVMITVNISEEGYEKTEDDSWTNEEIKKVVGQYVATSAFEEFCLDIIAEYAPEITEEGLSGE